MEHDHGEDPGSLSSLDVSLEGPGLPPPSRCVSQSLSDLNTPLKLFKVQPLRSCASSQSLTDVGLKLNKIQKSRSFRSIEEATRRSPKTASLIVQDALREAQLKNDDNCSNEAEEPLKFSLKCSVNDDQSSGALRYAPLRLSKSRSYMNTTGEATHSAWRDKRPLTRSSRPLKPTVRGSLFVKPRRERKEASGYFMPSMEELSRLRNKVLSQS